MTALILLIIWVSCLHNVSLCLSICLALCLSVCLFICLTDWLSSVAFTPHGPEGRLESLFQRISQTHRSLFALIHPAIGASLRLFLPSRPHLQTQSGWLLSERKRWEESNASNFRVIGECIGELQTNDEVKGDDKRSWMQSISESLKSYKWTKWKEKWWVEVNAQFQGDCSSQWRVTDKCERNRDQAISGWLEQALESYGQLNDEMKETMRGIECKQFQSEWNWSVQNRAIRITSALCLSRQMTQQITSNAHQLLSI